MQLFTSLPQINSLPASDLKEHLEHRYRTLYEDDLGPVFIVVDSVKEITGNNFSFIGSNGLISGLWDQHTPRHPEFVRPYEWVCYLPELHLYDALYLVNGEDGYWILIPEDIVEAHRVLKWVLTAPELGGLSDPQPL